MAVLGLSTQIIKDLDHHNLPEVTQQIMVDVNDVENCLLTNFSRKETIGIKVGRSATAMGKIFKN